MCENNFSLFINVLISNYSELIYYLINSLRFTIVEPFHFTDCHWVVIVLMFLSIAFGLLATTLATIGVCVTSLSWKLYYFHSAGEIYFVCG